MGKPTCARTRRRCCTRSSPSRAETTSASWPPTSVRSSAEQLQVSPHTRSPQLWPVLSNSRHVSWPFARQQGVVEQYSGGVGYYSPPQGRWDGGIRAPRVGGIRSY